MKKLLCIVLSILLIFIITACTAENETTNEAVSSNVSSQKPIDDTDTNNEDEDEELIGRMITHKDFLKEFSKRVDLSGYSLKTTKEQYFNQYAYTSKTDCEIKKSNTNFMVEIDGIKVNLPLRIEEFLNLGFEIVSDQTDPTAEIDLLKPVITASLMIRTPKGNTFSIFAIAKNYYRTPLKNLIVNQVDCGFFGDDSINYGEGERSDSPQIKYFGELGGESTLDDVIRVLETPYSVVFTESIYNGKSTLTDVCLQFNFSNEKYYGDVSIITYTVLDKEIERTSYISTISYRIDPESINKQ